MTPSNISIAPYDPDQLHDVVEMAVRIWAPVFPLLKEDIPAYVYQSFYPNGWEARQRADVHAVCADSGTDVYLASVNKTLAGFIGLRSHPESSMGEVYIVGVDPAFQRQGVGRALLDFGFDWMRQRGIAMAFVETGGDRGHAPSRAIYEGAGFGRYPVARYFREL